MMWNNLVDGGGDDDTMEKMGQMLDVLVAPEDPNTFENVLANALGVIPYSTIELNDNNHRPVSGKAVKRVFAEAVNVSLEQIVAVLEKKLKQVFIYQEAYAFKMAYEHLVLSPTDEWAFTSKLDAKITELTTLLDKYSRLGRRITELYGKYIEDSSAAEN